MILYDYYRSSAAYRVRIALNLKGVEYSSKPINLLHGEQREQAYRNHNPQGLVPALQDGERILTQSLAICEYLEEKIPEPSLLPASGEGRAYVRAIAGMIACDIHPLNNLRVLNYLQTQFAVEEPVKKQWYEHWITEGLHALEETLQKAEMAGCFSYGDTPTLADIFLLPQLYNARRFDIDYSALETINQIEQNCLSHPAFQRAHPDQNTPDEC